MSGRPAAVALLPLSGRAIPQPCLDGSVTGVVHRAPHRPRLSCCSLHSGRPRKHRLYERTAGSSPFLGLRRRPQGGSRTERWCDAGRMKSSLSTAVSTLCRVGLRPSSQKRSATAHQADCESNRAHTALKVNSRDPRQRRISTVSRPIERDGCVSYPVR